MGPGVVDDEHMQLLGRTGLVVVRRRGGVDQDGPPPFLPSSSVAADRSRTPQARQTNRVAPPRHHGSRLRFSSSCHVHRTTDEGQFSTIKPWWMVFPSRHSEQYATEFSSQKTAFMTHKPGCSCRRCPKAQREGRVWLQHAFKYISWEGAAPVTRLESRARHSFLGYSSVTCFQPLKKGSSSTKVYQDYPLLRRSIHTQSCCQFRNCNCRFWQA